MDVVCLGELLVDMFPSEGGKHLAEVSAFQPKPGGAPANVAVGLARLGTRSAFIGKVGDDPFGHHLADILSSEGVETRGIRFDDYARTTMAFIASPDPHTAEYVFYRNPGADMRLRADELDHQLLTEAKVLHFGSLSLVDDPIRSAVAEAIEIAHGADRLISLDVNYRPTLWDSLEQASEQIFSILPYVDLLKVNELELKNLSGVDDVSAGTKKLMTMGPAICVVTLGNRGSFFRIDGATGFVPGYAVDTVDATGCGDSFVAGLLNRLVKQKSWRKQFGENEMRENLIYANAVGALTATKQGVIPALPGVEQVNEFLAQQVD